MAELAPVVPAWVALVKGISDPATRVAACAVTLRVALTRLGPALAPLAEVGFATTHRELLKGAHFEEVVIDVLKGLIGWSWDRAGRVRELLVRTWAYEDWPPLTLLRAAQGDEDLFADLVREAKDSSYGKRALSRLWAAAQTAPDREPAWDRLLARLPSSVRDEPSRRL
jgi:hypothetical protein